MATDGERFTIYLMLRVINADEGKRMPDGGASRRLVGGKSMALLFPFSPKTTPKNDYGGPANAVEAWLAF